MRSFSAPTTLPSSCLPQYQVQSNFCQQNQAFLNSMAQPTFSLMPAVSYSSIPVCTPASSTNPMLGSNIIQSQQPVIFSASPGNFFLAQSTPIGTPVVGAPSFVFAPGQTNQNAFVVAHPLSQAPIAGQMATHTNPTNCLIRLPDGRFILPATAPNNLNLQASLTRICGPQPNYFPVTVSAPTSVNSSTISSLTPQIAQPSGQAFYIQMPTSCVSVGNTVFTTSQLNTGTNFQTHPMSTIKPGPQVSFANSQMNTLYGQSGTFLTPATVSNQPQLAPRPLGTNLNPACSGIMMNRPGLLLPTGCSPGTPVLDAYTVQNQQKLGIGTNTSQYTTNLQALPSGMAVARLPNGTYATVSLNSSSIGISGSSPSVFVNNNACGVSSTIPTNSSDTSAATASKRNASNSRTRSKLTTGSPPPPPADTDVLRRLDDQINALQRLTAPTEMQLNRLKQLVEVKHQLTKVSNITTANSLNPLAPRSMVTSNAVINTSACRNPTPGCPQITPNVRREILDLLSQHKLLPQPIGSNNNSEETFIVEFRLNQQRYQLRLTRNQKVDMERLLFTTTPQRQAEMLTVLQQEQIRLLGSTPRTNKLPISSNQNNNPVMTTTPSVVGFSIASQQSVRLPTGMSTFTAAPMHTFHGTSGLRLVTARPVVPPNAAISAGPMVRSNIPPVCSSTPVVGVVTALAVPSIGTCVTNPMFAPALSLNSSSTPVNIPTVSSSLSISSTMMSTINATSGLLTTIPTNSTAQSYILSNSNVVNSTGTTILTSNTASGFCVQSGSSFTTLPPESTINLINPIRPVALNIQQAAKIGRLRAYLTNDLRLAVDKPPTLQTSDSTKLPTPLELLEALAPYHVLNDADNTKEALDKVDLILEKSVNLLLQKKKETIEAVNSIIFKESLHKLEPYLEDRLLLANMALDLERDIFTAEKEIFAEVSTCDKIENCIDISDRDDHNNNSNNNIESSNDQSISTHKINSDKKRFNKQFTPSILKHSVSLLPSPWCNLLGPLAYLRPLNFDSQGNTTIAEIQLPLIDDTELIKNNPSSNHAPPPEPPSHQTQQQIQSLIDSTTTTTTNNNNNNNNNTTMFINSTSPSNNNPLRIESHHHHNNSNYDEDIVNDDELSDEAEADRLLGLDNCGSVVSSGSSHHHHHHNNNNNNNGISSLLNRSKMLDKFSKNGLLETSNNHNHNNSHTIQQSMEESNKNHSEGVVHDDEEVDEEEVEGEEEEFDEAYAFWQEFMHEKNINLEDMHTGLIENNFDNESNSLDEPPNKSLRLLDNGQTNNNNHNNNLSTVQHSEDPDIDAAIRSILSTTD
ncbi:unnamed protein product [Schistosoma turkestanicum]|nr:unnamed protein product [Schistosoma turkestanicum]